MEQVNPFSYSIGSTVRDKIFEQMIRPPGQLLDLGCGLGHFTNNLAKRGLACNGIDLDKACIKYCQEYMKGEYKIGDMTQLPFDKNSFDYVLCTEALEHVPEEDKVLSEIHRVMKDNRTLVLSVPCSSGILKSRLKNIGHNNVDSNSLEYHWHKGYTKEQIADLLTRHGFKVIEHRYVLIFIAEIVMAITKIVVRLIIRKKIHSQANALELQNKLVWRIYKKIFPIIKLACGIDNVLGKFMKGHMLIVKAVKV